jgi:oligoribonuclease NrnB/cAMP/cGMP phosphodiesterase (DHH superfamily)
MTHIFYHGADLDGKCSGAIAKWGTDEAVCLHPINYGDEFPYEHVAGQEVMMFDFSLQPFDKMLKLFSVASKVLWIDHHKASIEEYNPYIGKIPSSVEVILNNDLAACELVWQRFHPELPQPPVVSYLGKYDRWDHSDRNVVLFHSGMEQFELNPDSYLWNALFCGDEEWLTSIKENGKTIEKYKVLSNRRIMELSFDAQIVANGRTYKCLAINSIGHGASIFFSKWDPAKYDIMLRFYYNGRCWAISMYSDPSGPDVSAIAKCFGGGGHHGAAGFETTQMGLTGFIEVQSHIIPVNP